MALSITAYTIYLAVLGVFSTLLAEYLFHSATRLRIIEARAELEAAERELRELSRDKRGQRKRSKLAVKVNTIYGVIRRYTLLRTLLVLGFYAVAVLAVASREVPIPSRCPIPVITTPVKAPGGYTVPVTSSAIVLALSFLSSVFIVREDVVGILMLKTLRRRRSRAGER